MIVKLLTEHDLEFLSLKGGCTRSSESSLVKMSNCWKSHAAAQFISPFSKLTFIAEPDQTPFCLSMPHKMDARRIRVYNILSINV